MVAIHSLKPIVSQSEAIEAFRGRGIKGLFGRYRGGPMRSVADVYLRFHLYQVRISNGKQQQIRWLAQDAVSGTLDPYQFDRVPGSSELVFIETRNRIEPILPEERTRELLIERVRRMVFRTGFFRVRNLRICPEFLPLEIHVPYWIAFYGARESVRLRVLDAVRNRIEGGKARAFFESWLSSPGPPTEIGSHVPSSESRTAVTRIGV